MTPLQRLHWLHGGLVDMTKARKGFSYKNSPNHYFDEQARKWRRRETAEVAASEAPAPYSTAERSVLLALVTMGEVPASELKARGLSLPPASQKRLAQDRLLTVRRKDGGVTVELSDDGWAWAAEEMAAGAAPEKGGPTGAALYAMMGALDRFMKRNGLALADVFGDEPLRRLPEATPPPRAPMDPAEVESQILRAYQRLRAFPGASVQLADVREQVPDASREELDAALMRLYQGRVVALIPNENLKTITPRDRASALRVGDRDRHIIVM